VEVSSDDRTRNLWKEMTSYIFQQLATKGKAEGIDDSIRQRDARTWFREKAKAVAKVNPSRMLKDPDNVIGSLGTDSIGKMYMFFYDPKFKKQLPYYDTFPLIFMIGPAKGGFLGMNLHYLPPVLRANLMDALYGTVNNTKFDNTTKLAVSYQTLVKASRFRYFKPCIKHYLNEHVQSSFLNIEPRFWDAALLLPTERFKKATNDAVWSDSRAGI
jgi:hypothetical protein